MSMPSQFIWAQRDALHPNLRALYDSFNEEVVSIEKIETGQMVVMQGMFSSVDLELGAVIDAEDDVIVFGYALPSQINVLEAYSNRYDCESWSMEIGEDGGLWMTTWLFEEGQEDLLMEFVIKVLELDGFLEEVALFTGNNGVAETLFDLDLCVQAIEENLVYLPVSMRDELKPQKYCSCLANQVEADPDLVFALMDFTSPQAEQLMRTCWSDYCPDCGITFEEAMGQLHGDHGLIEELDEKSRRSFVHGCMTELMDTPFADDANVTFAQMEVACNCMFDEMRAQKDMTMVDLEDEHSVVMNEMFSACLSDLFLFDSNQGVLNAGRHPAGCRGVNYVPLLRGMAGTWKVKLGLGDSQKYFLIDSGASELVINEDWASQLRMKGVLSPYPTDVIALTLADGRSIAGEIYEASSLNIGECHIDDFEVVVVPEGGMLCGMGVLSLFSSWQIDEPNEQLILSID
ncbi:MAG: retropepsin-like aspartic protease [Bacteroidetes bacterium]|nr:retropepsin-like aspartic protease [Bacteroidota bacterium]MDA1335400.1 retropepsin-like aspartic protease [Bacteroidota bacterium]